MGMKRQSTLTSKFLRHLAVSMMVLLVLTLPILYYITTQFYAEDLIRVVRQYGLTNVHLDLEEDTMMGLFIQFFTILLAMMAAVFLVMRTSPKRLWRPFFATLGKISGFRVEDGKVPVLPQTDVKEFAQLNDVLNRIMTESIKSYNVQKEFTENASHELQTPLAVARGKMDNLMQDPDLTPHQGKELQDIYDQLSHMSRLTGKLLMLSKMENNQYQRLDKVNLVAKIEALLPVWQGLAVGMAIKFGHDDSVTALSCSEVLLESMLNNLVVNAIRHSNGQGSIDIDIRRGSLRVSNTSDEKALDAQRIFSRFYRSNMSRCGNGLGLAIVKAICDYHKWTVGYSYEAGKHVFSVVF